MSELTKRGSKKKGSSQNHLRQGTLFDNFLVTREPPPAPTFATTPLEPKDGGSEEQATVEQTSTKDNEPLAPTDVLEPAFRSLSDHRDDIESSLCSPSTQGIGDVDVEISQDLTISQEYNPPSSPFDVDLAPSSSLAKVCITDPCTAELGTPSSPPVLDPSPGDTSHIIDLTMDETENAPILVEESPVLVEKSLILVEESPILESPPTHMAPPLNLPLRRLPLGKRKEVKNIPFPDAPYPSASMQHVRDSVLSVQAMPGGLGIGLGERRQKTTRASPEPSTPREPLKLISNPDDMVTRHPGSHRRVRSSEHQANANAILSCHDDLHPAVSSIFRLASELDDLKEASQQHWNQKWRPRRAEHILGNEQNACYLREWMHALRLHFSTMPSSHGKDSKSRAKKYRKRKRGDRRPEIVREVARKRQRAGKLDGWMVDDEDDEDDEIIEEYGSQESFDGWSSSPNSLDPSEPQPVSFGEKIRNTILLVGPPGCGKTAAVYACAEELGWNVFEVYPGLGKRGGTHLDELIGDVGKNHTLPQPLLFHRGRSEPPSPARKRSTNVVDTSDKAPETEIHPQSVVLIEEADVVFADEGGFWPSVVAFIKECRRPVIITCNDVSLIPLDTLPLQNTLTFNAAPEPLISSLLNAICQVEGRPPIDPPDLERQVSTADLRQRLNQCQLGLTGKPEELADMSAFSFQVKLENAVAEETEADERKNLYALRQCLRGADAASSLDACVLLAQPHNLEIADNHPDDEVGYKALKTRQRTTIPVHPEYYSRDVELTTTGLITFEGILERNFPGMSLADAGETGQSARREEYRRRLWEGLKTDPALKGMVDLPRLYLDYRPMIGMMVKVEDEEIAKVTGRVKGRSSRLTERSCRWLSTAVRVHVVLRCVRPRCRCPVEPIRLGCISSYTFSSLPINMVEKEGKMSHSPFAQSDRPSSDLAIAQTHLNLRRTSGDSSHKSPRRTSTTDASHIASPSFAPKLPHPASRTPFNPADTDSGRDHLHRIAQSSSRPPSPFKSSDRSSNSPDRSHSHSYSHRTSIDVSEGTNSAMHTPRDSKHKTSQTGQPSPSHTQTEAAATTSVNSQTPQRGSSSPSLPHGTKRKLSSDRNMPTTGGDDIDSQLIGPGVPSSINIGLEGPALKRRGSIAETQRVNIFDNRRHSMDARSSSGGPQLWSSGRRDSSSSMFTSPPVSYGSPAYSADSSHGHPPGTTPFAWQSTQFPDQTSTVQSEGDGSSSGRPFDPSSVPPIAMVPPVPFNAERRISRSRPPSVGRARAIESAAADSTSQPTAGTESGANSPGSSSMVPSSANKESGMTPYSRSPELRVSHKLAERKRRKEMKELFDELRDQLPADRGMKASKWEILSKAIDFIAQLKQGHQDMSREIDMLRHELESIRSGVPFGSGAPHPGMYAPGPTSVVPYPSHSTTGHTLPSHPPASVTNHQSAPPPQSDSRPSSSHNAFNSSSAPQSGSGGGTSGSKPEASSSY